MLETIKYINHIGEEILLPDRKHLTYCNNLRDYEWSIDDMERVIKPKKLLIVFIGENEKECRQNRMRFYRIVERDVADGIPGNLYIGEYRLPCYFSATENDDYLRSGRMIQTTYTIVPVSSCWIRNVDVQVLYEQERAASVGFSYPYSYPYKYGIDASVFTTVKNESLLPCDFMLMIEGPATDPVVSIGGHPYGVKGTIDAGSYVVIDSVNKTVKKIGYGTELNWYNRRLKEQSVFEKIPSGENELNCGDFSFLLTLYEEYGEPKWAYTDPIDMPTQPDEESETDSDELTDAEGLIYITSDEYIYITSDEYQYICGGES